MPQAESDSGPIRKVCRTTRKLEYAAILRFVGYDSRTDRHICNDSIHMSMSRLNETITVKLPQDVRNELAEVARDNGMSMSHVVREYIIEGLKRDN